MSVITLTDETTPPTPDSGKTALHVDGGEPKSIGSKLQVGHCPLSFNYIRNSGFWFIQRGAGTFSNLGNTGTRTPTLDGWCVFNGDTGIACDAISAITSVPEITSYGSFTKVTNAARMSISQQLETIDSCALRGQTVRLTLWARAISTSAADWRMFIALDKGGTSNQPISLSTISTVPSGQDIPLQSSSSRIYLEPRGDIQPENGTVVGNGVTMHSVSVSTWRRYGAVFDIPVVSGFRSIAVFVTSMENVPINSGIMLANAQLTMGVGIQPWMSLTTARELKRVQRFYSKSFSQTRPPAQNTGLDGACRGAVSEVGAAANQPLGIRYPVPMVNRVTGNGIAFYNPSAVNAFVRNTTRSTDATATAASSVGDNGMDVLFTGVGGGGGWAPGDALAVHYVRDSDF